MTPHDPASARPQLTPAHEPPRLDPLGAKGPHGSPDAHDPDEAMTLPRRRAWPALLVIAAIVGGASAFAYRLSTAPKPLRVLVSVDFEGYWWQGSEPAAAMSDKLAGRLTSLGFDVVRAGDPEVMKILEKAKSPEEAAKKLRAAFVVEATVTPEVIEHDSAASTGTARSGAGYFELRVETPVTVRHVGEPPIEAGVVNSWSGAHSVADARKLLASGMADKAFDAALTVLMDHATMKEVLADRASPESATINPAVVYREARDKELADVARVYGKLREHRITAEKGSQKPLYLSAPSAHDELIGVGARGALIHTGDIQPFWSPDSKSLGWFEQLETLQWRAVDVAAATDAKGATGAKASDAAAIFRGYNIYGYASASPDGSRVTFVEDLFGWAKTVSVLDDTTAASDPKSSKKARRLRVDTKIKFVGNRISNDGAFIATYAPPGRSEGAPLVVMSARDGKTVYEIPHEGGKFEGMTWLDGHRLAFVHDPAFSDEDDNARHRKALRRVLHAEGRALWIADVSAHPVTLEAFPMDAPVLASNPSASARGDLVVMESDAGNAVVVFDVSTHKFVSIPTLGRTERPQFSPNGTTIAFGYSDGEDEEIGIVATTGGPMIQLTDNDVRDRYPMFSADGKRVIYETIDTDPAYPRNRYVSWIASVPVP